MGIKNNPLLDYMSPEDQKILYGGDIHDYSPEEIQSHSRNQMLNDKYEALEALKFQNNLMYNAKVYDSLLRGGRGQANTAPNNVPPPNTLPNFEGMSDKEIRKYMEKIRQQQENDANEAGENMMNTWQTTNIRYEDIRNEPAIGNILSSSLYKVANDAEKQFIMGDYYDKFILGKIGKLKNSKNKEDQKEAERLEKNMGTKEQFVNSITKAREVNYAAMSYYTQTEQAMVNPYKFDVNGLAQYLKSNEGKAMTQLMTKAQDSEVKRQYLITKGMDYDKIKGMNQDELNALTDKDASGFEEYKRKWTLDSTGAEIYSESLYNQVISSLATKKVYQGNKDKFLINMEEYDKRHAQSGFGYHTFINPLSWALVGSRFGPVGAAAGAIGSGAVELARGLFGRSYNADLLPTYDEDLGMNIGYIIPNDFNKANSLIKDIKGNSEYLKNHLGIGEINEETKSQFVKKGFWGNLRPQHLHKGWALSLADLIGGVYDGIGQMPLGIASITTDLTKAMFVDGAIGAYFNWSRHALGWQSDEDYKKSEDAYRKNHQDRWFLQKMFYHMHSDYEQYVPPTSVETQTAKWYNPSTWTFESLTNLTEGMLEMGIGVGVAGGLDKIRKGASVARKANKYATASDDLALLNQLREVKALTSVSEATQLLKTDAYFADAVRKLTINGRIKGVEDLVTNQKKLSTVLAKEAGLYNRVQNATQAAIAGNIWKGMTSVFKGATKGVPQASVLGNTTALSRSITAFKNAGKGMVDNVYFGALAIPINYINLGTLGGIRNPHMRLGWTEASETYWEGVKKKFDPIANIAISGATAYVIGRLENIYTPTIFKKWLGLSPGDVLDPKLLTRLVRGELMKEIAEGGTISAIRRLITRIANSFKGAAMEGTEEVLQNISTNIIATAANYMKGATESQRTLLAKARYGMEMTADEEKQYQSYMDNFYKNQLPNTYEIMTEYAKELSNDFLGGAIMGKMMGTANWIGKSFLDAKHAKNETDLKAIDFVINADGDPKIVERTLRGLQAMAGRGEISQAEYVYLNKKITALNDVWNNMDSEFGKKFSEISGYNRTIAKRDALNLMSYKLEMDSDVEKANMAADEHIDDLLSKLKVEGIVLNKAELVKDGVLDKAKIEQAITNSNLLDIDKKDYLAQTNQADNLLQEAKKKTDEVKQSDLYKKIDERLNLIKDGTYGKNVTDTMNSIQSNIDTDIANFIYSNDFNNVYNVGMSSQLFNNKRPKNFDSPTISMISNEMERIKKEVNDQDSKLRKEAKAATTFEGISIEDWDYYNNNNWTRLFNGFSEQDLQEIKKELLAFPSNSKEDNDKKIEELMQKYPQLKQSLDNLINDSNINLQALIDQVGQDVADQMGLLPMSMDDINWDEAVSLIEKMESHGKSINDINDGLEKAQDRMNAYENKIKELAKAAFDKFITDNNIDKNFIASNWDDVFNIEVEQLESSKVGAATAFVKKNIDGTYKTYTTKDANGNDELHYEITDDANPKTMLDAIKQLEVLKDQFLRYKEKFPDREYDETIKRIEERLAMLKTAYKDALDYERIKDEKDKQIFRDYAKEKGFEIKEDENPYDKYADFVQYMVNNPQNNTEFEKAYYSAEKKLLESLSDNDIPLSLEQLLFIKEIVHYLSGEKKDGFETMRLDGHAGTGKSSMIKYAVQIFNEMTGHNHKVGVMGKTADIRKNLIDKMQGMDTEDIALSEEKDKTISEQELKGAEIIVIDEWMLLTQEQRDNLTKHTPALKLLLIGDYGQIAEQASLKGIKHRSFPNVGDKVMLTKQRAKIVSIGQLQDVFRGNIKGMSEGNIEADYKPITEEAIGQTLAYSENYGVQMTQNVDALIDEFKQKVGETKDKINAAVDGKSAIFIVLNEADRKTLLDKGIDPRLIKTAKEAQGLTYKDVYIYTTNITGDKGKEQASISQAMLTAVSRAENKVILSGEILSNRDKVSNFVSNQSKEQDDTLRPSSNTESINKEKIERLNSLGKSISVPETKIESNMKATKKAEEATQESTQDVGTNPEPVKKTKKKKKDATSTQSNTESANAQDSNATPSNTLTREDFDSDEAFESYNNAIKALGRANEGKKKFFNYLLDKLKSAGKIVKSSIDTVLDKVNSFAFARNAKDWFSSLSGAEMENVVDMSTKTNKDGKKMIEKPEEKAKTNEPKKKPAKQKAETAPINMEETLSELQKDNRKKIITALVGMEFSEADAIELFNIKTSDDFSANKEKQAQAFKYAEKLGSRDNRNKISSMFDAYLSNKPCTL